MPSDGGARVSCKTGNVGIREFFLLSKVINESLHVLVFPAHIGQLIFLLLFRLFSLWLAANYYFGVDCQPCGAYSNLVSMDIDTQA